jgi:hypothetical protein
LGKLQTLSKEYIAQQLEMVTSTFGYLLKMQPKLNSLLKIAAILVMQNDMERTHLTLVTNLFWPGLKT